MDLIKHGLLRPKAESDQEPAALSGASPEPTSPVRTARPHGSPLRARTVALLQRLRAESASSHQDKAPGAAAPPLPLYALDEMDLNRIHLTGTLGSEPLLYDIGDHPVAALTLASEQRWRTGDGMHHRAQIWFNLSAWEELAEHCGRLLHRGDRVYVEGYLHLWIEPRPPQRDAGHTIVLDRVVLLGAHGTTTGSATDGAVPAP